MDNISIRRIKACEVEAAMELVWEVFQEFETPFCQPLGTETFERSIIRNTRYHDEIRQGICPVYGAFDGGRIVAVMGMRSTRTHINLAFTKKEYHRKGIATALFRFLLDDVLRENPSQRELTLNASPYGLPFYLHLGFIPLSGEQERDGLKFTPMKYIVNTSELIKAWRAEERIAHIHGWDFSHIDGRYDEEGDLPWDYRQMILAHLRPDRKLLDIDTGGGEFLLSLNHPHDNTAATENYPPNVALCRQELLPLGIDFRQADGAGELPFDNCSFDLVLNRHGDFNAEEIYRVLKPGGLFITQQVGAENDRELAELLCGKTDSPFPEQYLDIAVRKFREAGFEILEERECFRPIRFFDVGALVWFARIIQWEFPGFSVDTHLDRLLESQRLLERDGCVAGNIHRFLLAARKRLAG